MGSGFYRVLRALFKHGHIKGLCHHLKLAYGGGAVNIAGYKQRALALLFEPSGKLAAHGGFTGTLKAAEHYYRGRCGGYRKPCGRAAHEGYKLLVHKLYYLLPRSEAGKNIAAHGFFGNRGAEILGHPVVDIRLQKSHAHLAHSLLYIGLGQPALAGELFEYALQFFGKRIKSHNCCLSKKKLG